MPNWQDDSYYQPYSVGALTDAISCTVTETTDGQYEAELVYPVNGLHFDEIQNGMLLYCTTDVGNKVQPFIIYKREADINGTVTFRCHHLSYALNYVVLKPNTWSSVESMLNGLKYNTVSLPNTDTYPYVGWRFTYTEGAEEEDPISMTENYRVFEPITVRAALIGGEASIASTYGLEIEWDGYTVILHTRRGEDRGVTVRYGYNVTNYQQDYDTGEAFNAYVPFWVDSETNAVFPQSADINYVEHAPDGAEHPGKYRYRLRPLDLSADFESQPTQTQLNEAALEHLNADQPWIPFENMTINFAVYDDKDSVAYDDERIEQVRLYDTVYVNIPQINTEIKTRVIKTVYNVLLDRYDSVEVGQPQTNLSDIYASAGSSGPIGDSGGGGGQQTFDNPVQFNSSVAMHVGALLKVAAVTLCSNASIAAINGTMNGTVAVLAPSGFTPVAVVGFEISGTRYVYFIKLVLNNGSVEYSLRNTSSNAVTVTVTAQVLCLRTSL